MTGRAGWIWVAVGAVSAAAAVAMGAVGAHLTSGADAAARLWMETAARYHLPMALGLVLVGGLMLSRPGLCALLAAWGLALGSLLFSGGLYLQALAGLSMGPLVPLGGTLMILGWLLVALHAVRVLSGAAATRS